MPWSGQNTDQYLKKCCIYYSKLGIQVAAQVAKRLKTQDFMK